MPKIVWHHLYPSPTVASIATRLKMPHRGPWTLLSWPFPTSLVVTCLAYKTHLKPSWSVSQASRRNVLLAPQALSVLRSNVSAAKRASWPARPTPFLMWSNALCSPHLVSFHYFISFVNVRNHLLDLFPYYLITCSPMETSDLSTQNLRLPYSLWYFWTLPDTRLAFRCLGEQMNERMNE